MDAYFLQDEKTAKVKLNEDLDDYFAKKPEGGAPAEAAAEGEPAAPAEGGDAEAGGMEEDAPAE